MPPWLVDGVFQGAASARTLLAAHLDGVLPVTRPAIRDRDVVNEAVANPAGNPFTAPTPAMGDLRDSPWLRAPRPDYIDLTFRLARERDHTLRLTYNDYGLEGDTPWAEEKRQRLLLQAGVPIDALALQGHLQLDEPFRPEPFAAFLTSVREMGLAVLITELDMREGHILPPTLAERDALVAERVRAVVGTALEGGCRTVLTWGLSDKDSWLAREPGVMRRDGHIHRSLPLDVDGDRKPMWRALRDTFIAGGRM
jgi:endo-1,4-beta-xylanase